MESYDLEPMQKADGGWAAPCPKCQRLVEAATQQGLADAVVAHLNAEHARFFGDGGGRDC